MKLAPFEYAEPKSLRQAYALLQDSSNRALIIAGGTDLLQALKNRLKAPGMLLDLRNIPHFSEIQYGKKTGLRIGALVSLRRLASDPIVKEKYPMLAQAAGLVGTPQLQAMGTVGGNLCQDNLCLYYNRPPMTRQMLEPCHKLGGDKCHAVSGSPDCWAVYSGDLAPVLLALGAQVVIAAAKGKATIPLKKLFSGNGKKPNVLRPGQILTEIQVPPPAADSRGVYLKLRMRKTIDYPLLGVAVRVDMENGSGVCKNAALALTGIDKSPLLIREAQQLKGKRIGAQEIAFLGEVAHKQAHPLGNVSELSPKYRRDMIRVYVRLAFEQILKETTD